jgi:isocitrate lyase
MTLLHLYLIHRYRATTVHYVSPTDDNRIQAERMQALGVYAATTTEIGEIIVAEVNRDRVGELLAPDRAALRELIEQAS